MCVNVNGYPVFVFYLYTYLSIHLYLSVCIHTYKYMKIIYNIYIDTYTPVYIYWSPV